MKIPIFKGNIGKSNREITGFIILQRLSGDNGTYEKGQLVSICANEFTMPNSDLRGCFFVNPKTVEKAGEIEIEI